jgi:type VI secretion system protein ImpF
MARTELDRAVLGSLFDRLTDEDPQSGVNLPLSREESTRRFRRSVQRDLEQLLNTRRTMVPVDARFGEVLESVHEFGVPDTTGLPIATAEGREQLTSELRDAINRFEPRLVNVVVRITESDQVNSPQVRFAVEATLRMDPTPEQILFDTVLEVSSSTFAVDEGA